jgi:hypothetical protein
MGPQSHESPSYGNFGTPTWESQDKMPFRCGPLERRKIYYKGEGGDFPEIRAMVNLVSPRLPMVRPNTKSAQTMH